MSRLSKMASLAFLVLATGTVASRSSRLRLGRIF